jgi:hypothetical protein
VADVHYIYRYGRKIEVKTLDTGPAPKKKQHRLVAFPWAFLVDVCRLTEGRTTLVVAMYIYRRTHVCRSQTVTLPITELRELGIDRKRRHEALINLEAAGLIRLERMLAGRSTKVTLTWKPN